MNIGREIRVVLTGDMNGRVEGSKAACLLEKWGVDGINKKKMSICWTHVRKV